MEYPATIEQSTSVCYNSKDKPRKITFNAFYDWWINTINGSAIVGEQAKKIKKQFPNRDYLREFNYIK